MREATVDQCQSETRAERRALATLRTCGKTAMVFVASLMLTGCGWYFNKGQALLQTASGEYVLAGSTAKSRFEWISPDVNACLVKTDSGGGLLWSRNYPDLGGASADDSEAFCVAETDDGGFAFAGQLHGAHFSDRAFLARTDDAGNLLWSCNVSAFWGQPTGLIRTQDGCLVVVGRHAKNAGIAKYSRDGALLWQYALDFEANVLQECNNATLTVAGVLGSRIVVRNLDADGKQTGEWRYDEGVSVNAVNGLVLAEEGDCILLATEYGVKPGSSVPSFRCVVLRVDSGGAVKWRKEYDTTVSGTVLAKSGNDRYVYAVPDFKKASSVAVLHVFDGDGNEIITQAEAKRSTIMSCHSLVPLPSGGVALVGDKLHFTFGDLGNLILAFPIVGFRPDYWPVSGDICLAIADSEGQMLVERKYHGGL